MDVEGLEEEVAGLVALAECGHEVAELDAGDGQIALVVGALGFGLGELLVVCKQLPVAGQCGVGVAEGEQRAGFGVGQCSETGVGGREGGADLTGEAAGAGELIGLDQELANAAGDAARRVERLAGEQVAGGFDGVAKVTGLVFYPPPAVMPGAGEDCVAGVGRQRGP